MSISIKENIGEIYGITVDFSIKNGQYDVLASSVNGRLLPSPIPLLSREFPLEWGDIEDKFEYYINNLQISNDSEETVVTINGIFEQHDIIFTKGDDMCILIGYQEPGVSTKWLVSPFKQDTIIIMCSHADKDNQIDFTRTITYGDNGYVKSDTRRF